MPPFQDFLVCGISTQLQHEVKGFDKVIDSSDADLAASGLLTPSLIRLGFLAVLPQRQVVAAIGAISAARHERLLRNLSQYLRQGLSNSSKS